MRSRGLLAQVAGDREGFIPGRPASRILLEEVLAAFRFSDLEAAHGKTSAELARLISDLEAARKTRIGQTTLADLLPRTEDGRAPEQAERSERV
jgi:DNA-binding IscR family transcriptional regulator